MDGSSTFNYTVVIKMEVSGYYTDPYLNGFSLKPTIVHLTDENLQLDDTSEPDVVQTLKDCSCHAT